MEVRVEPSGGGVRVTARIFASISGVNTVAGLPGALRDVRAGTRPSRGLKSEWEAEQERWRRRDLSDRRYV